MAGRLNGVIAAITTPIKPNGDPDTGALISAAQYLLENGCNGLNVLGTTGEATSFSTSQRISVMKSAGKFLPVGSLMVGIGAASVADATNLAQAAEDFGFAGALVLPPFYYKGVSDDGIIAFFDEIVAATEQSNIPLYLYNFPALSGIKYSHELITGLISEFGARIAGLKDSSGEIDYARAQAKRKNFDVFPGNEAYLFETRKSAFAGCISATANVNSRYCAAAFTDGDAAAQKTANDIRAIFSAFELVPAVKSIVAHIHGRSELAKMKPPLRRLSKADVDKLVSAYEEIIS